MPFAFTKFFAEAREFTEAQIAELREGGLLREDEPSVPAAPAPVTPPPPIKPPAAAAPADQPKEND